MCEIYGDFAAVYDRLMYDVDYSKWADYLENIFSAQGLKPSLVLDLGCGTGSLCIELAGRGYEMIGVDSSAEMLDCARTKAEGAGRDVLLLNQDMREFELYGTVDVVLCMMDSINYLLEKRDVLKVFKLVRNYLNPGGIFIFDLNSAYKLETILGNNVFYDVGDETTYIWQNTYDKRSRKAEFDLTFFVRDGEQYRRYDEIHYERAYAADEIKGLLEKAGMHLLNQYDELSFVPPGGKSERIFFVAVKE